MSLGKILYPLLSTGSIPPSGHDLKIVDWDVNNQNKQTSTIFEILEHHSTVCRGVGLSKFDTCPGT